MAQKQSKISAPAGVTMRGLSSLGFAPIPVEAMGNVQRQLLGLLDRVAGAATKANIDSEAASPLTGARSIPESATAYQIWIRQRMEASAEDWGAFFAGSRNIAAGTPFPSKRAGDGKSHGERLRA